jgi:hypothetical protein
VAVEEALVAVFTDDSDDAVLVAELVAALEEAAEA